MPRILIAYSTVDGQTLKICERIRQTLQALGHAVTVVEIREDTVVDAAALDTFVIGASIRYGKYRKNVYGFIDRHRRALEQKPGAFFSVNVVARKPGRDSPDSNPYIKPFIAKAGWTPAEIAVFAGKIDYARYHWRDRLMIRFIMWMTKGPTQPDACVEFTDWQAVDAFARRISSM